jgi:hypothetical protein
MVHPKPIFGWLARQQAAVLKLYAPSLNGVVHEGFIRRRIRFPVG